eukprot:3726305-Amphidinium_carterae.1
MWAYGSWRGVSAAKHDQVCGEEVGRRCQGVHARFNCVSADAKELNVVLVYVMDLMFGLQTFS